MTTTTLGAVIKTQYDGRGAEQATKGLKSAGDAAKKAGDDAKQGSAGIKEMYTALSAFAAAGVVAAAGRALIQFGRDSITAASGVEEMQAKFTTVFGDQADGVTAQLQRFADTANRSIYDLQGFAATFQDTFVPLGFAREEAAKMSVELVKLSEDLASFNNLNTADVVRDIQSAMVGNTETLRKYGVVASQAAIEAHAVEQGMWDGIGAINAQEKAAAILSLTLQSTTDAQGDAIATADSFANSQRGLEAALEEVKVQIGQELLPLLAPLVSQFADLARESGPELVGLMQEFAPALQTAATEMSKLGDATAGFLEFLNSGAGKTLVTVLKLLTWPIQMRRGVQQLTEVVKENNIEAGRTRDVQADARREADRYLASLEYMASTVEDVNKEQHEQIRSSGSILQSYIDQALYADRVAAAEERRELALQEAAEEQQRAADANERHNALIERNNRLLDEATELVQGMFVQALEDANSEMALYVVKGGEVVVNSEAVGDAIMSAGQAAGLTAAELALISPKFLEMSEAQQEAILKSVIFQVELEKLKDKLRDGDLSAMEFRDAALELADEVNNLNFDDARSALGTLESDLVGLTNRDWAINVRVSVDQLPDGSRVVTRGGTGPGISEGPPRAAGGPVSPGTRYTVGERGVEEFVPATAGTIVPNGQSGETHYHLHLDGPAAPLTQEFALIEAMAA